MTDPRLITGEEALRCSTPRPLPPRNWWPTVAAIGWGLALGLVVGWYASALGAAVYEAEHMEGME